MLARSVLSGGRGAVRLLRGAPALSSAVGSSAADTAAAAVTAGPWTVLRRHKYSEAVVEHFNNPQNSGTLDSADPRVGTGLVGAPACGDAMRMQIRVEEEEGTGEVRIVEVKQKTFGCGSAMASSSLASSMIVGKTLDEALEVTNEKITAALRLPPVKRHCSMLAEDSIQAAINDLREKQKQ